MYVMKCAFLKDWIKTNFMFALSKFFSGLTPDFQSKVLSNFPAGVFTWLEYIYRVMQLLTYPLIFFPCAKISTDFKKTSL